MNLVLTSAAGLAGLYGLALMALFLRQRRILFRPDTGPPDLARAGVTGVRAMRIETGDGLSLLAWFRPPPQRDGAVVLYLHGNAGHIGYRAWRLEPFGRLGLGVLLLEYRGYGGNPGSPSEAGLRADAAAGMAALQAMGFPLDRILLWGESLGSGLAVWLAAGHAVAGVVLEAPFTSIAAIARGRFPFVPVDLLLLDRFDSLSIIGGIRAPVLVMHGALDGIIPAAMGRAIHHAAPEPKRLWIAPEAGHDGLLEAGAMAAVADFLRNQGVLRSPRPADTEVPNQA